ncbi:Terpene synthase family, metal binding domain [Chitinophaga jiangningensis]|uniref:Terpene synthase n=1 Tax=Chitinophaga jiangningensis TaxID=1419482 RepID=A0A1M7M5H8_9BACT|nr:hypothetical protein [Chitinophaga jiangningensis]SHM85476.1 Terpene synthase family, metal binding domain [Chitinophaga jiangningensis]
MNLIHLPQLKYPFPSRVNARAEDAQTHIQQWVQKFDLITDEKALFKFNKARFAWLAARAFPDAPFHELCLIADFNTWLFLLDDQCDENSAGKKSDYLRTIMAGLMDIFHTNKVYSLEDAGPLPASLSDIWERMRAISKPSWRLRFIRSMEDYFNSCIWEAENREAGRVPSVKDYVRMRPFTGALFADVEAIDIIEKIYLPEEVLQNAILQRMILACNNIVCWANDIISCTKESKAGDVHNLVLVLKHELGIPLQDAVAEATRMHNEELAIFLVLEKLLPYEETPFSYELIRYVAVLRSWMIGNYEWSVLDTGRYGVASALTVAD